MDDEIDQFSSPGRDSKAGFDGLYEETLRFAAVTLGLGLGGEGTNDEDIKDIPRSNIEAVGEWRGPPTAFFSLLIPHCLSAQRF